MVRLVELLVWVFGVYLAAGAVVAGWLHLSALSRIDPGVKGAGVLFRILITPGMVALWPLMLRRSRGARPDPARPVPAARLRRAHAVLARTLAILLPLAAGAAILLRPPAWLPDEEAGRLSDPPAIGKRIGSAGGAVEGLPLLIHLRRDSSGAYQIETELESDAEIPSLVLYWNPGGADVPLRDSFFLGRIWGPGTRRFAIPRGADVDGAGLVLYSLARRERLGAIDVNRLRGER